MAAEIDALKKELAEKTLVINELRQQLAQLELKHAEKEQEHKSAHFKEAVPHPVSAAPANGTGRHIPDAKPYAWPYNGAWNKDNTAIIVIDMQNDFCAPGGYVDHMKYDLKAMRAPIEPIQRVLKAAREKGYYIIHTREGHMPDLSDCPANKRWRSKQAKGEIGSDGALGRILVRGSKGQDTIPECYPLPHETVIDKPGKGSFIGTNLELILRTRHIQNVVLCGVTTDVCVHTTMRDANDMGFECLLLSDCCAATDVADHIFALKMITMQGGVFGCHCTSHQFVNNLP
jgi:nicotinamidase-related amidase